MPAFAKPLNSLLRLTIWITAIGGSLLAGGAPPPALAETPRAAGGERPVLTVDLSSVNKAYADAKFVFDLVGDQKGYQTFKETIDVYLAGVNTGTSCDLRIFATPEGLATVGSLPIASDGDFKKFVRNLWDIDVKTAPPPEPRLIRQVPAAIRSQVSSLKLQPNERLIFGMRDGFVRYEKGRAYIAETLDAVRYADSAPDGAGAEEATLALRVDGRAAAVEQRRAAFEKSREQVLSRMKKNEEESDAEFAFRRTLVSYQLAKFGLIFSESSQARITWTTSHSKKRSDIDAEIVPAKGTSLEKNLQQVGQLPDAFAGVSKKDTVLSSMINMPVNGALAESFKTVVKQGQEVAQARIDNSSNIESGQKETDRDIAKLIFDVMDDVSSLPVFNGFLRIWLNNDGTLTTVAATRVSDGLKLDEAIQKIGGREKVGKKRGRGSEAEVEICKVTAHQWHQDYQELFDKDGSVYIGASKNAVWYAAGENALQRLEQSIEEAGDASATAQDNVFEMEAEMRPLAEVWSRIHSRLAKGGAQTVAEKGKAGEKPQAARAASVIASLNLPKLATEAYRGGHDVVALSLKRHDDREVLAAHFDEGTLRFIGQALSQFVKDNLQD